MAKTVALGTKLYIENPATAGFLAVGNLLSVDMPSPEKPEINVTDMDSLASEFLMGLPDNGELPFSGWYNGTDTGQDAMEDDAHDPNAPARTFRVDFVKQNKRYEFEAYVKSFQASAPGPNDAYAMSGVLRITGAVTRSAVT